MPGIFDNKKIQVGFFISVFCALRMCNIHVGGVARMWLDEKRFYKGIPLVCDPVWSGMGKDSPN